MSRDDSQRLRVVFLYSNERTIAYREVVSKQNHGAGFWGMIGLSDHGIDASFLEIEQYFAPVVVNFLRKHINVYFIHTLLFPKILRADVVYTSAAFGTQLLHALWPFRKPLWVMHDFSIATMVGDGSTLKQRVFRWMVSKSAGIVTLGAEEADRLKVLFPHLRDRIAFIPFGADLSWFKPEHRPRQNMILAVGRDPDRDWKSLVVIAPELPCEVVIATHERRVAGLRPLPDNVTVGQFNVDEFRDRYQESKVFVLPLDTSMGLNDAMGCSALFEALALGKAIVATNTHTMRSYITDGENGLLVPEREPEALKEALLRVLGDDSLRERLEQSARAYAEKHLDIDAQTKRLADFFRSIAK